MPSPQKRRIIEKTRKREKRGRIYLIVALVLIAIVAVGVFAYASSQSPKIMYAKLNTSYGTIEIELYGNSAPKTVNNFVNLANSGFYSNLLWHRVAKGFVIQTGDPTREVAIILRGEKADRRRLSLLKLTARYITMRVISA